MNNINLVDNQPHNVAAKARDFRLLDRDEAIRKHPDLANAYALIYAAELVAEIQLAVETERVMLTLMMKETVAERIEQHKPLPVARIRFERPRLVRPADPINQT